MTIDEIYQKNPLLKFSVYTHIQSEAVRNLGNDILSALDKGELFPRAYDGFWFWTLGGYEVLRTMDENSNCFEAALGDEIRRLKRLLAEIRMPFAKQKYRGKNQTIKNEASVFASGLDGKNMIFEVDGTTYDASKLIKQTDMFFAGIQLY
ncbi:hypothetical protein [Methylocystis sp.]|uniref:hypothetical protein n=1 Tax=Methylocystis sp. TaxID=1911079 RepID=UPI003DA30CFF